MRKVLVHIVIAILTSPTMADVWTSVYRCDETTPLAQVDPNRPGAYQDIMVGTRLVIVVSSDTGEYWWGHLRLSWDDAQYASLSGRGPTIMPGLSDPEYIDSCLEAAGDGARAWDFSAPQGIGLEFCSSHDSGVPDFHQAVPGDWFIFDYQAEQPGSCEAGLYDPSTSYDVPIETLCFTHVPSRDFDGDTIVNFEDLALLAGHWHTTVGQDRSSPEAVFDLNSDSHVDTDDLALFSEYWLEPTDCSDALLDADSPSSAI